MFNVVLSFPFRMTALVVSLLLFGGMQVLYGRFFIHWRKTQFVCTFFGLIPASFLYGFFVGSFLIAPEKIGLIFLFASLYAVLSLIMHVVPLYPLNIRFGADKAIFYVAVVSDSFALSLFVFALTVSNEWVALGISLGILILLSVLFGFGMKCLFPLVASSKATVQKFTCANTLPKGNGEKIKIVLLGGQSNASGVARHTYFAEKITPAQQDRLVRGFDNVMLNFYCDNGGNFSDGFTFELGHAGCQKEFFGPELGLMETIGQNITDEKVFVVKYSWGGSNLYQQWKAPEKNKEGGSLYIAFINYVKTSLEYLRSRNYNPEICAMCWMQGESDAFDPHADLYGKHQSAMVDAIRADLADYIQKDGMYFIDAGISDSPLWTKYKVVNQTKKDFAGESDLNIFIDTIAENISYKVEPCGKFKGDAKEPDIAHYDSWDEYRLGQLFGNKVVKIIKK